MLQDNISLGAAVYLEADRIKIIELASQSRLDEAQQAIREAFERRSAEFEGQYRTRLREAQQVQKGCRAAGNDTAVHS